MNLGAVVPLISGTTAHPSGTTAGGAEHGTKGGRTEQSTVAVVQDRRNYRALLPRDYC